MCGYVTHMTLAFLTTEGVAASDISLVMTRVNFDFIFWYLLSQSQKYWLRTNNSSVKEFVFY